MIDVTKKENQ